MSINKIYRLAQKFEKQAMLSEDRNSIVGLEKDDTPEDPFRLDHSLDKEENLLKQKKDMVNSWIKFVGSSAYRADNVEELRKVWEAIRAGDFDGLASNDDAERQASTKILQELFDELPNELHGGVRFHLRKIVPNMTYPTWDEVIKRLKKLIKEHKERYMGPIGFQANPKYQEAS